jgi:hypothetical protein
MGELAHTHEEAGLFRGCWNGCLVFLGSVERQIHLIHPHKAQDAPNLDTRGRKPSRHCCNYTSPFAPQSMLVSGDGIRAKTI